MTASLRALLHDESGAVLAEYGVIVASLVVAGFLSIQLVSNAAYNVLTTTFTNFTALQTCPPGSLGC